MNRFFVPPHWIEETVVQLKESYAHQIVHVLRLKPGDGIVVLDNTGNEYGIELTDIKDNCVLGLIKERRASTTEPRIRLTLFQSLLKRDKFEWVLQKCTEVGVALVVPVITRRSLVQHARIKPEKKERWQTIMKEAAEQCGRGRIPELDVPMGFSESLNKLRQFDIGFIASPQADNPSLADVTAKLNIDKLQRIGLWVGPEGGFDPSETEKAVDSGIVCIGLGKRILRTETAAVVASALILHELGEL